MFQFIQKKIHNHLVERKISRTRLVTKDGHCNIKFGTTEYQNHFAFLMDFWTTFVEIRWCFVIVLFVAAFTGSWFIFGLLWYSLAKKTQTTIGYGGRALTGHCPGTVALLIIQSLMGAIINCFMCGLILAKISLPKRRAKTVTFSETAVVSLWNGNLCLQIRVANLRKTLLIGSQIYGKLLRTTITPEGDTIILDQVNVDFSVDAGKDNLFFVCPITLYHVIDKSSPFSEMCADVLQKQDFELVVFLEGTAESTSLSCQARTSYLPQEIQWGYGFLPVISRTKAGKYRVDLSNFCKTEPVVTPQCACCFQNKHNMELILHQHTCEGIDNLGFDVIDLQDSVDINEKGD
ncbi:ATP-sensitive inward rectifier potassium channel 1b isoform X2 [Paramisgurnus dabryanus]|uniref:ATP-sensitive inward rectifier potassium channel 1b isoform X2 n=1 Tax=Paramisgurnus dabryanus TaxID=90735 RepID=UPI0031F3A0FC